MLELEDAVSRMLASLPPPANERIALRDSHQRVLAENIRATLDLPPFDNSAMDGYAVRTADVAPVRPASPVKLRLAGRVVAGETFPGELQAGHCVRLFTGSPLPRGADAVVMQEDTRTVEAKPDEILILDSARRWENTRRQGEDVARGTTVAQAGEIMTPGRIALLAAMGIGEIEVGKRPVVGLLATGSELREAGQPLAPGQIYESNRAALAPLVICAGGLPKIVPLVPDTPDATRAALERALSECDVIVTSGGVSVGEMDFVKTAFESLGGKLDFWKVAIKPGRPFVFGWRDTGFLFGLPGNPVSAIVTFLLLVRPALRRWQGARELALPVHPGVLAEPLVNSGDRRHFMRVHTDAAGRVYSSGLQASHALGSLAAANGLVDVPRTTTLAAGDRVVVQRWD